MGVPIANWASSRCFKAESHLRRVKHVLFILASVLGRWAWDALMGLCQQGCRAEVTVVRPDAVMFLMDRVLDALRYSGKCWHLLPSRDGSLLS